MKPPHRPILYSFRRCPFAIRARLALLLGGVEVELREVSLKLKPPELLRASAKATVPVLVVPQQDGDGDGDGGDRDPAGGRVIEESLDIMAWASSEPFPTGDAARLIADNDGPFKHHLDRFKYASRFPDQQNLDHWSAAMAILMGWNHRLARSGWLLGSSPSLVDWALLPFVRQFRLADPARFDAEARSTALHHWLASFLRGSELATVMTPPWATRQPWCSPAWIYHLALEPEWREACLERSYRRSTRGLGLEQAGFVHASHAHQVAGTFRRFYADAGKVLLLTIDPRRLTAAGIEVREEAPPGGDELFPHIHGPIPLEAVLAAEPYRAPL